MYLKDLTEYWVGIYVLKIVVWACGLTSQLGLILIYDLCIICFYIITHIQYNS